MDRLEAMSILIAAVESGSLSAASRKLNVPLPTVSRKVAELEEHLKTRLLTRSTRKLTLTDAGAAYLSACKVILDAQLLSIPASALILDQEGLRVAVVDQGDRVHFKRVAIARDLGKEGRDSDWAHRDSSSDHDTARRYRRRRPSENRGRSHQAGAGNGRTTILAEGSVRPRFSDAVTLGKRCAGGGDRRYLAFASTGQN
ncbi:regulatory helix-turn-helix protein, lysR family [Bradyrhizobium erythrophlei]|jgi:hypothetical protein|nr:regulatory helix-turn-helix protein, lysR family [Bradyrhizobium erythrophlei]